MLAARARGAVGVHAQIGGVHIDFERVIDFRVDEDAGKRRVASAGRIEGALADQAVHAGFGAQVAEGVFAFDLDRGRLDARDFAVGFFKDLGLEALAFGVLEVLAQQHRGPVLRFRAARAGLDVQEAVQGIGRIREHAAEFQAFELFLEGVGVLLD
ncbi:hypothetical protein D3C71_1278130 [compost metagenome]